METIRNGDEDCILDSWNMGELAVKVSVELTITQVKFLQCIQEFFYRINGYPGIINYSAGKEYVEIIF